MGEKENPTERGEREREREKENPTERREREGERERTNRAAEIYVKAPRRWFLLQAFVFLTEGIKNG